ncbi:HNH endonuclease [Leptodesmis sichuanensis]|uniref:HNH endonuclease n=1 Tax=Leptodesmis sichuanensis TaxID=2906798 RepID=UPI0025B68E46|nr:HNH endonuclease [Leptodesmis sichuanensis]UIE40534.1 HNH endonuclease [Leptodesmis sichuanensis A121]
MQTVNNGIPLSFDHILPRSHGGTTTFENVCLACRSCNEFKIKQAITEAAPILSGSRNYG